MRKRFATGFLGSLTIAVMIVACQPVLDTGNVSGGRGRASAPTGGARAAAFPTIPTDGSLTSRSTSEPVDPASPRPTSAPSAPPTSAPTTTTTEPAAPRPDSPGGDIEHDWYGSGPKVAIFGDSLTVQARPLLREMAEGHYALKVGALYGEGISGGALSMNLPAPIMPAVIDEYAEDQPDVVVLALGTNDVWQQTLGVASFEREWHHATRAFPEACLVGVTVTETDRAWLYDPVEARQINRVIRRTVDVVADWSRQGESEHLTGADSIHLTEAGQQRFAEMVMASTERCLAST